MILHESDLPVDLNYAIRRYAEAEGLTWGEAVFSLLVEVVPPSLGLQDIGDVIFYGEGGTTYIAGTVSQFYDGRKNPTVRSLFSRKSTVSGSANKNGDVGVVFGRESAINTKNAKKGELAGTAIRTGRTGRTGMTGRTGRTGRTGKVAGRQEIERPEKEAV